MLRPGLLILGLAAGALALDVPAVPTWPSGHCTDKSLTIPSWIISNYKVSSGITTFRVDNRAADPTGLIADITCTSDNQCQGTGNDELRAYISPGSGGPVISLSEIWTCGDAGDEVIFTASGNTTITECSGTDCVSPIPYLVYGTLALPVPLTPTQPSPPPGYDAATCATVGADQWTVTGISYQNYTKGQCKQWYETDLVCLDSDHLGSNFMSKGIYLNLTVTNNAIEYEVACGFAPSYNSYALPSPLVCTGGDFNEITLEVTWSGIAPAFTLEIDQLWYCLENPQTNVNATLIVATGTTPVSLDCTTTTGITGASDDLITSCTSSATPLSVNAVQTVNETLPAFSLVTAYPVDGGCTFDSVVSPTWYMRGLFFETNTYPADDPDSATLSRFTCGLTGPGFADYFFYQSSALSGSGIDTVYDCSDYGNGQSVHWNCTYSFDPFQKVLTLDKVWQCTDKDAAHPLYFDGSGSFNWNVDPYSQCTTSTTSVSCFWTDSLAELQPGIPYDIPKVTVSLVNVPPVQVVTIRVNGKWGEAD